MINRKLLRCAALCMLCLALSGCGRTTDAAVSETVSIASSVTPVETNTPKATESIFGKVSDNGDVEINSEILDGLKPRVYEFPKAPTILIYHTHATEAFSQDKKYKYVESEKWRTEDNDKNIVHAGEVLKTELKDLGFNVIHDTTNVEPPDLESAYSRSIEVMKKYKDVDIYIDLHRNAADPDKVKDNTVTVDGKKCAKMFFVVGTGVGTYEGEYDVAPDWKANYEFARSVREKISEYAPGIAKPIRTKVGRFNQHLGMCLLIELGNNANTMEEALNTLPYLVKSIGDVVKF